MSRAAGKLDRVCEPDAGSDADSSLPAVDAGTDVISDAVAADSGSPSDAGACSTGFADCNGNPGDGCETSLSTTANCGSCGVQCTYANATGACLSGSCSLSVCQPGYGDCDGDPRNGCEVSLTDPDNCGGCGVSCDDGDVCTTDSCDRSGCAYADSGMCSCPGNSCPGGSCGTCAPNCSCDQTCGTSSCTSTCSATSTCALHANSVAFVTQTCNPQANCVLDCSDTASCTLECRGSAQCLLARCEASGSCTLRCDGALTDCGGGVKACNRACP